MARSLALIAALLFFSSGYAEYVRRPVAPFELVTVPTGVSKAPGRHASHTVVDVPRTPCRQIEFPRELIDELTLMRGKKVRFKVDWIRGMPRCRGWSAVAVDGPELSVTGPDVVQENESHAIVQMLLGVMIAFAFIAWDVRRRRRARA